eukprot:jgi/Botrbrau1/4599/Bobra.60_2s0084.1
MIEQEGARMRAGFQHASLFGRRGACAEVGGLGDTVCGNAEAQQERLGFITRGRQRKSTSGWSIWMVLLDFAGGGFSLFQLCLEAWVLQDLSVITGDAIKFGLGIVSMIYNLLFMLQHTCGIPENLDAERYTPR